MVKKVISKIKISEEKKHNLEYWAKKSDREKLSAVQELREQYIIFYNKEKEYDESRSRLRRFYKAFKRTQS